MPKRKEETRRDRSYSPRRVNTREPRQRFLIVCEGVKTEPLYFEGFRAPTRVVRVRGTGENTLRLVRTAMRLRDENRRDFDQVWCVFDRDSFPAQDFNSAIMMAEQDDMGVAYSNESFELWYLLHFRFQNTAIGRDQCLARVDQLLNANFGRSYEKNRNDMYDLLLDRQQTAIENAERLLELYEPLRPAEDNPSTTVHLLVKELLKYSR